MCSSLNFSKRCNDRRIYFLTRPIQIYSHLFQAREHIQNLISKLEKREEKVEQKLTELEVVEAKEKGVAYMAKGVEALEALG